MTLASRELHMTQPGISQHIKSLEERIGTRLFDRIRQRLVPTSAGNSLYKQCSQSIGEIERTLAMIQGADKELQGTVSIGMPIEFGNNVILPTVAPFAKEHAMVKFRFKMDFASVMNELILKGDLDFAFIDDFTMHKRISTQVVFDEELELCIAESLLKKNPAPKKETWEYFESLPFIEYQEDAPMLRLWFGHHLGARNLNLGVKASVMDVQGVARLIQAELGAGVLPGYLVRRLKKQGAKLHCFRGSGKPLHNTIRLAYLRERTFSPAAQATMDFLKRHLSGTGLNS
jgi:DNA-binding transcriptional LysR family regulator